MCRKKKSYIFQVYLFAWCIMTYYQEFYEACKGESVRELEKYLNKYAQLLNTQFEHDVSPFLFLISDL